MLRVVIIVAGVFVPFAPHLVQVKGFMSFKPIVFAFPVVFAFFAVLNLLPLSQVGRLKGSFCFLTFVPAFLCPMGAVLFA